MSSRESRYTLSIGAKIQNTEIQKTENGKYTQMDVQLGFKMHSQHWRKYTKKESRKYTLMNVQEEVSSLAQKFKY